MQPANSCWINLKFYNKDTVSADFNYKIFQSCFIDSVAFSHDGRNGVNQWFWNFDYAGTSTFTNPGCLFHNIWHEANTLEVSNGVCSDTVTKTINLDNTLKATFETNNLLCPEDTATFVNKSVG